MYTTGTHIESHYDHQLQTPYCTYLPQHQWIQSHHCVNVSEDPILALTIIIFRRIQ